MIEMPIGTRVDVTADGEYVLEDFRGVVIGNDNDFIQVRDQEDHVYDCDRAQIKEVIE
jgi:3D (Asp-Asp-Asp) domain-containing protein